MDFHLMMRFMALHEQLSKFLWGYSKYIPYFRVCTASGDPTPFSDAFGFSGACSGQSNAAQGNSFSWHELTKPPKTLPYTSLHALPRPYRQANKFVMDC